MKYVAILMILFPMVVLAQYATKNCDNKCTKNQQCTLSDDDGMHYCNNIGATPGLTPGLGATEKDFNDFHHGLVLAEKGILICQSKIAMASPDLALRCVLNSQAEAKVSLTELYRNNWKLINAMKTEKGYLYYLDKK